MKNSGFNLKIGRKIASLRKEKGLSQERFSEISGKMINTISKIERGLGDPQISTLASIADALDVHLVDLINVERDPPLVSSKDKTMTSIIKTLKTFDDKTLLVTKKQIEALSLLFESKN